MSKQEFIEKCIKAVEQEMSIERLVPDSFGWVLLSPCVIEDEIDVWDHLQDVRMSGMKLCEHPEWKEQGQEVAHIIFERLMSGEWEELEEELEISGLL